MEFKTMTTEELQARNAEIKGLLENEEAELDLDALTEEVRAIKEELEERKAKEAEAVEIREAVANEEVETEKIEEEVKPMEERTFAVDSTEYRNAWLKNLMGKQLDAEERGAITGTDAIPTETLNKIIVVLRKNPLLGKIDLMQIPGYVKIPVYSTNNDASWATTSSDSADVIGNITLTPFQLIKTIEVPATVDKMSIPAFEAYITQALANRIEIALQKAVIAGAGADSSTATGIITTKATADGEFTKAAVAKKDLLKIMGDLDGEYQEGACWIMPAAVFYDEVMNISNISDLIKIGEGFDLKLFGHDVILDSACVVSSVDNILYGQPKAYHMNMGEGIKVDKDMSVGFRSNSAVYRAVCLADGKLDAEAAFVRYTRATS